jgi:hypothetical protein
MKRTALLALLIASLATTALAEDPPAWEQELRKKLEQPLTLNFAETPLTDACGYLSRKLGVDIVIDPKWDTGGPVTLALEEVGGDAVLSLLTRLCSEKGAWDLRWGGVFVGEQARLDALPKDAPGELEGLEKRANYDFAERNIRSAVDFLAGYADLKVTFSEKALSKMKGTNVSNRGNNVSMRDALCRLLFPLGFAWEVKAEGVVVGLAQVKSMETIEEKNRRLVKATTVSLNFEGTPVTEALNFLSQCCTVPIHLDPVLMEQVSDAELLITLNVSGVTVKNALELITLTKSLAFDYRYGGVFVARADRLKVLPRNALPEATPDDKRWMKALRARLEEPVSFAFDSATVEQALDFIRTLKGLNIVIDPAASSQAEEAELTLSVSNVRMVDALALALLPRGFSMKFKNEVILVSLAE